MLGDQRPDRSKSTEEQIGNACLLVESGDRSSGVRALLDIGSRVEGKRNADRILWRMLIYRLYDEAEQFMVSCKSRFGSAPPYAFGEKLDLAAHRANFEKNRAKQARGEPLEFSGSRALFRKGSAKRVVVGPEWIEISRNRTTRTYSWSELSIDVSSSPARQGGSPATAYIRKTARIQTPDGESFELDISSLDSPFGSPDLLESALRAHSSEPTESVSGYGVSDSAARPSRSAVLALAIVVPIVVAAVLAVIEFVL